MSNEKESLKEAFRNSGLLRKVKHDWTYDQMGGSCSPFCRACELDKTLAKLSEKGEKNEE